jgi:hypothetical protein
MNFMLANNLQEFALHIICTWIVCFGLFLVGNVIYRYSGLHKHENEYRPVFYSLILGFVFTVSVYATLMTAFKSVLILVVIPALLVLLTRKGRAFSLPLSIKLRHLSELAIVATGCVIVLNTLPESTYKQMDSFFYLKISESLSMYGQENTNNYYNGFSKVFHGAEAYHYMELWLNNLLLHLFSPTLPNIQVFRIVSFGFLSVAFIFGLFYLAGNLQRGRLPLATKILCASFIFFYVDILPFLPTGLQRYMVFGFETSFVERPNFRIVYLFLVPVVGMMMEKRPDDWLLFFLVALCVVNPTVILTVVPAMALLYMLSARTELVFLSRRRFLWFIAFVISYAAFYFYQRSPVLPPMYQFDMDLLVRFYQRSWKYILLTIASGFANILLILLAAIIVAKAMRLDMTNFLRDHRTAILLLLCVAGSGILVGRLGDILENFYQVAFNAHVAVALLVFILFTAAAANSSTKNLIAAAFFVGGFIFLRVSSTDHKSIFRYNGAGEFGYASYSNEYIKQVSGYLAQNSASYGAYIADSSYYNNMYYSARNPNVYHLPLTYVLANQLHSNVDFCLSDTTAILHDDSGKLINNRYLLNAIDRSWFHISHQGQEHSTAVANFISRNNIHYLICTRNVRVDTSLIPVDRILMDSITGERFLILKR